MLVLHFRVSHWVHLHAAAIESFALIVRCFWANLTAEWTDPLLTHTDIYTGYMRVQPSLLWGLI